MSHRYTLEDPIVRVALDLVHQKGPCGWYSVCNFVTTHPWFVDFSLGEGYHALAYLLHGGMITEEDGRYRTTGTGEYCLKLLKTENPGES